MRRLLLCLACVALAHPALAQDTQTKGPTPSSEKTQDRVPGTSNTLTETPQDKPLAAPGEKPTDQGSAAASQNPDKAVAAPGEKAPDKVFTTLSERTLQKKPTTLSEKIAVHAKANNVPESLVRRVIVRESRYNPRARGSGGAMGLMQIKHATARGMGYRGTAAGLLDAETNLTYAVRYLGGAYRAARGNTNLAVAYYAKGYYHSRGRVMTASAGRKPAARQEATASSPRRETDASAVRHGAQ